MGAPITTVRCVLRDYQESDRVAFVALNVDPEVRLHMNGPLSREQASDLFDRVLEEAQPERFSWAVSETPGGGYLGHAFLVREEDEGHELGFMLHPQTWGRGLATEIVGAIVARFAKAREVERIFATADEGHCASHRVLEKTGFCHDRDERDEFGSYRVYVLDGYGAG